MRKTNIMLWGLIFWMWTLASVTVSAAAPPEKERVLVGRVSHLEGELLYFVPESSDWVSSVVDAPFGLDDAFYAGEDGRAEFVLPNRTRLRIGPLTQIQLIAVKDELTQVDVASGTARFFNNSDSGLIKVTTPFGYAVAEAGAAFDMYVGDESAEVIPIEGNVDFVSNDGATRYDVEAGSSIFAAAAAITDGDGTVDAEWQSWNDQRDSLVAKRLEVKGDSVKYLPEGLHNESHVLDEHGRWETVEYEGARRDLWRPSNVDTEWEPFTEGRWTVYHGDNAWIPEDEPFGYLTHHYGNWVYLDAPRAWYWMPPVIAAPVRPAFGVGFSWYPGRVGWVHSNVRVGWFPLAPHEPYYAHRYWGPRTVVVRDVTRVNININNYRFVNRTVVVPENRFFGVRNYRTVRIRDIDRTTIVRNFRPAPFVDNRVIRNFRQVNQRFYFRPDGSPVRVPHRTVEQRIRQNQRIAARAADLRAQQIERNVRQLRQGEIQRRAAAAQRSRITNRLVARNQANLERRQVNFQQRELKRREVQLERAQERRERARTLRQQRREQQSAVQQRQRQQQLQRQEQRRQRQIEQRQQQQQRREQAQQQRTQRLEQQRQRQIEQRQQRQQSRQQQLQRQEQRRQQTIRQQQQRREQAQQQRTQRLQQQRQRQIEQRQQRQQVRQQQLQRQEQRRQQALRQQQQRREQLQQQRTQRLQRQQSRQQQLQRQEQRRQQAVRQQQQRREQLQRQQQQQRQRQLQQQQSRRQQMEQQRRSQQMRQQQRREQLQQQRTQRMQQQRQVQQRRQRGEQQLQRDSRLRRQIQQQSWSVPDEFLPGEKSRAVQLQAA